MQGIAKSIDHRTLRSLVSAGAVVGAEVVGHGGSWGVVINYGRASQTLAAARGEPRSFRKFETLAAYLKEVGIVDVRVNLAAFEPGVTKSEPTLRGASSSERLRATHAAAQYDRWFRQQVQDSIDDPRPNVPHDQVMVQAQTLIDATIKNKHGRKAQA
jgi:hypothetical protein